MESIFPWPDNPMLSVFVLWLASTIILWAARRPMLKLVNQLGDGLGGGIESASERVRRTAEELAERNRAVLLATGIREAQGRLERELHRMDDGYAEQMGNYGELQRRLNETLVAAERDYQQCGVVPPEVPGWSTAVETLASVPVNADGNIQKILEVIKSSSLESEKKALKAYRNESATRLKTLGGMLPYWKEIRGLLSQMGDSVSQALESASRVDVFVEDYVKIRDETEESARSLTYSAMKYFFVSLLVLGIAIGGVFINFQLISLPMSELVPAGTRVGGISVSAISALVIVLMEAALGIFIMDMLGITEFFPKLSTIPRARRRLILWLGISGLFFLSGVEASLAILREQIVEADAALKLSLAGEESRIVDSASQSMIPVVGQAVLGFILPWVLALVAVPLEMLLDSGRHVAGSAAVLFLRVFGASLSGFASLIRHLTNFMANAYDVYVSVPLRMEEWARGAPTEETVTRRRKSEMRRIKSGKGTKDIDGHEEAPVGGGSLA